MKQGIKSPCDNKLMDDEESMFVAFGKLATEFIRTKVVPIAA